jgi:hypothetical protein
MSYYPIDTVIHEPATDEMPDGRVLVTYQVGHEVALNDHVFTDDEKEILRPIAETIAMLDGNAFFDQITNRSGKRTEWYEQYLPEAMSFLQITVAYPVTRA